MKTHQPQNVRVTTQTGLTWITEIGGTLSIDYCKKYFIGKGASPDNWLLHDSPDIVVKIDLIN
jgi:hypothetical protein